MQDLQDIKRRLGVLLRLASSDHIGSPMTATVEDFYHAGR